MSIAPTSIGWTRTVVKKAAASEKSNQLINFGVHTCAQNPGGVLDTFLAISNASGELHERCCENHRAVIAQATLSSKSDPLRKTPEAVSWLGSGSRLAFDAPRNITRLPF